MVKYRRRGSHSFALCATLSIFDWIIVDWLTEANWASVFDEKSKSVKDFYPQLLKDLEVVRIWTHRQWCTRIRTKSTTHLRMTTPPAAAGPPSDSSLCCYSNCSAPTCFYVALPVTNSRLSKVDMPKRMPVKLTSRYFWTWGSGCNAGPRPEECPPGGCQSSPGPRE